MSQKNHSSNLVTKKDLKTELNTVKKDLKTELNTVKKDLKTELNTVKKDLQQEITALEVRIDIKFDKFQREIDDNAQKYRDQVLTKIDGVVGQLETLREDSLIGAHQTREIREQVDNHEKRLVQLEKAPETA